MAAKHHAEAPRALVLTERADLAGLSSQLAALGIQAEVCSGADAGAVERTAVAVVDGGGADTDRRIRSLRAGGTRVVALAGSAPDAIGDLYRAGADVVFHPAVDPEHIALQCCALLEMFDPHHRVLRVGEAVFEPAARRLLVAGRPIRLTEAESRILLLLVEARAGYVSRDAISRTVFAIPYDRFDRRIDVHVSNLRRKLREHGVGAAIETSRLNGFRLAGAGAETVVAGRER